MCTNGAGKQYYEIEDHFKCQAAHSHFKKAFLTHLKLLWGKKAHWRQMYYYGFFFFFWYTHLKQ